MNRKQYLTALIAIITIGLALIVTNTIWAWIDWLWVVLIMFAAYMYFKYKLTGPLQVFSTKFNMLVDYDLDVQEAKKLCNERVNQAPTSSIKNLYMVYLGMASYYAGDYEDAIKVFNQIELKRLNNLYHVLIFAFSAYSANEIGDEDTFELSLERIKNIQGTVNQKYLAFVSSYVQVLEAIKNLEVNPEHYREVIEAQFARNDGYLATKLTYNYRLAHYYKVMNDELEMDKCLAKVIANGKEHHTAIQARKMFKNNVDINDYVFQEEEVEDIENIEDQQLLDTSGIDTDNIEEIETIEENEEIEDENK